MSVPKHEKLRLRVVKSLKKWLIAFAITGKAVLIFIINGMYVEALSCVIFSYFILPLVAFKLRELYKDDENDA